MAFCVTAHFDGAPSPGVLSEVAANVVLAPPGDVDATRALFAQHKDIAAAIIEPTGASWGQVPVQPDFLRALTEMTRKAGALLIFDEVISGFRCAPGGAQEALGITPDLTTLAKILAGGLPGGAVAGRKSILDWIDHAEAAATGREKIVHQGTFNANPLSAAAGVATLESIVDGAACRRANDYAARLREALNRLLHDQKVPWFAYGTYSGFHIFTNPEQRPITLADIEAGNLDYRVFKTPPRKSLAMKLRVGMLLHGVEIFSWPGGPTSAVHSEEDLLQTVDALSRTIVMLREEGEL
jgi:glutamate-1-semialdehyde 2,1-aminomutase